jgi:methylisocitrate lyase
MKPTTTLKALIERPEILVMPGAYDPISAKLVEQAGFEAIQVSGLGVAASHLGMPDVGILSLSDICDRTRAIVNASALPVMADGDTGFGNAVNVWYTVQAVELTGAAGINLEDQIMPKRCGHLDGKEVISCEEMVSKILAAVDARKDLDFVINARTDALAVEGLEATIDRANAYFKAGASMVFVDGADDRDTISALADAFHGPLAINMVEGGKTPDAITFAELQRRGVARVSLPVSTLLSAIHGMQQALAHIRYTGTTAADPTLFADFTETHSLIGMEHVYDLERRFLSPNQWAEKYSNSTARRNA